MNWGYHIKRLREQKGMTQAELATSSGLLRPHISRIEMGAYQSHKQDTFERLARGLDITIAELSQEIYGSEVATHPETPEQILDRLKLATPVSIPVYTDFPFHAGDLTEPIEFIYRARPRATKRGVEGYLVHGRCLEPQVQDNDIIIVDREAEINTNDIVACLIKDELMIGRLKKIADDLWIENGANRVRLEDCQVVASVIEVIRRLK